MRKKILSMSLVLVMVLSFPACAGGGVELTLAQEIVDGVIESLDDIRTGQFDMDMTMDMAGEAEGETFEATMVMDSSGALDFDNRQMRMDLTMYMAMPGEPDVEMAMEIYFIGDMMYMLIEVPGMGPTWMKAEMPEGSWEQMSQVQSQVELLEAAQVEVIGSEKVRGVDCHVLQLTPDMAQLWQLAMQQAEVTETEMPAVSEEFVKEMFRSFSVKQWIAKDTYFLTKAEIDMAMELTPEAMGLPGEEGMLAMDIAIAFLAYNYNQPVSIVLPPEAEEAIEVPIQ